MRTASLTGWAAAQPVGLVALAAAVLVVVLALALASWLTR